MNNPKRRPPVVFTFGLLTYAVPRSWRTPRSRTRKAARGERSRPPTQARCSRSDCSPRSRSTRARRAVPDNLLNVTSSPDLVQAASRAEGIVLGLVWAPLLATLAIVRLARSTAARRLTAPVLVRARPRTWVSSTADYTHSRRAARLRVQRRRPTTRLWVAHALGALGLRRARASRGAWVRVRRARRAAVASAS